MHELGCDVKTFGWADEFVTTMKITITIVVSTVIVLAQFGFVQPLRAQDTNFDTIQLTAANYENAEIVDDVCGPNREDNDLAYRC